jgi:hypothetical protein
MREGWKRVSETTRIAIGIVVVVVLAGAAIGITATVLNRASASSTGSSGAPAVYELQAWASGTTSIQVAWSCDVQQPQGTADATQPPAPSGTSQLMSVPTTVFSATGNGMSCTVTKQEVGTMVVQLYRNGTEVDSVNSGVNDGQSAHVGS